MGNYRLSDLLSKEELVAPIAADAEVKALTADSRAVTVGTLFFALPGSKVDGAVYVPQALQQGAVAAVVDAAYDSTDSDARLIRVHNTRRVFALAAAAFYGQPGQKMKAVGITGTNGKTTTTYLLENIAFKAGYKPGVVGTVSYRINGETLPSAHTTPPADYLQKLLAEMAEKEVSHLFMEVSSHSLDQHRVDGIPFAAVGFSNLTQDHLDYHHDLESYFNAKKRLFTELSANMPAVINIDDPHGRRLAEELGERAWKVSTSGEAGADCLITAAKLSIRGIEAELSIRGLKVNIHSPLMGKFNLDNIIMAASLAAAVGFSASQIEEGINSLQLVPGRLEQVKVNGLKHPTILVDYAHTPDALARALECVASLKPDRLICVFGCGGDRDNGKRPLMGREAAKKANLVVVTSDNPRTEDPTKIIDMILPGVLECGKKLTTGQYDGYWVEPDRRKAISQAISVAKTNDLILIAGKGHEDYQIIGTTKHHFSDQEIAREEILKYWGTPSFILVKAISALTGVAVQGDLPYEIHGVDTDSRREGAGKLFVALKGEKFNGHDFVDQALANGFAAAMVNKDEAGRFSKDTPLIIVPDTYEALAQLANWYRRTNNFTIVGLTGSVGKTTTKEMVAAAINTPYKTAGNLNNQIGVPLSLLALPHGTEVGVIEMGTSGPGEISRLAAIAEPDIALITNIRPVHLEGLGSLAGIAAEKGAIYASQKASGVAVVNISEDFIAGEATRSPAKQVVRYASTDLPEAEVALLKVESSAAENVSGLFRYGREQIKVTIPLLGEHNLINCCAALAVAYALKIPASRAISGLLNVSLPKGRLAVSRVGAYTVIDDTYNANPASVKASAAALLTMAARAPTMLCLGNMAELGENAAELHRELGSWIGQQGFSYLLTVGDLAENIAVGAGNSAVRCFSFAACDSAVVAKIKEVLPAGGYILVKGSRSSHMEKVIELLQSSAEI